MPLDALIFDVDGTLAETEETHRLAFNDAFAQAALGWHWSQDLYRRLLRVTGGKERIAHYARGLGQELPASGEGSIAHLHAVKTERYNAFVRAGHVKLRPGVARLLAEARDNGFRLAIATTTSPENVETLLAVALGGRARDHFPVIAAGDMVQAKKPAPDVYLLALQMLAIPAGNALAFEDSTVGLAAASRAGLATIVTPSLYTAGETFAGALAILPDLERSEAGRRLDVAELRRLQAAAADRSHPSNGTQPNDR